MPTREQMQADFERALMTMDAFAAGEAPVQKAARKIARALKELGIPYAVAGALAVAANGLERQTVDFDLILTKEGLAAFKQRWLGLGWVEPFQGSKGLRDTEYDLKIHVLPPMRNRVTASPAPSIFSTRRRRRAVSWNLVRPADTRLAYPHRAQAGKLDDGSAPAA